MRKLSARCRASFVALALLTASLTANQTAPGGHAYAAPAATLIINLSVNDATQQEPASGTAQLLFTVMLSTPAPAGGLTVNYATASGGGNPATGGASCGGSTDYVNTSGTLAFAPDEQMKTVAVNVCADAASESDETFLLNLSDASAGNIADVLITDGQAVGTIKQSATPGVLLISELRTSGPGGAGDDFVELYNNTTAPVTVSASDGSGGYGLYTSGTACGSTPVLVASIANGTVIPARGHYLLVGSQYGLGSYAAGDQTLASDIESDRNVALFSTADVTKLSTAARLDAVGFGSNTGGNCDLLREGTTLGAMSGSALQYSFFRSECGYQVGVGCASGGYPKDTDNNASDFLFADTTAANVSGVGQRLGAPGPEALDSPIRRDDTGVLVLLLDGMKSQTATPNRDRDFINAGPNAPNGTLYFRRRVQNTTGSTVTRLRFRVIDMTTAPTPPVGTADMRALTSTPVVFSGITDPTTCASTGTPTTVPCQVTAQATTLETPPAQPNGGGYNSTLSVSIPGGLANNASIDVNFALGVVQGGSFRHFLIVEALP